MNSKIDISTEIAGIKLASPVIADSGTFGYGDELLDLVDVSRIGAITTKTVTLGPRTGNPPPRICETASGMLNTIGLQNIGLERFLQEKLEGLKKLGVPVIVSIAGSTAEEYVAMASLLNQVKFIAAIELNLSCPNLKKKIICQDEELFAEIIKKTARIKQHPVIAKLSPQVQDIPAVALLAERSGADALSLVNTFSGMSVDVHTFRPRLSTVTGGLSGPCIKPLALRCVWEAAKSVKIPVIGGGGISSGEDAAEFIIAGACAVSVGTASLVDPDACTAIADGLREYLRGKNLQSLQDIKGKIRS
jgi:dihydroorotate dehydrogenase (NAD+) catalytic subunit